MKISPAKLVPAGLLLNYTLMAASFQSLGDLPGGTFASYALGVSSNGQVVVGTSISDKGYEGFRWTATNGITALGALPGGSFGSEAMAVSGDGNVIVGYTSSSAGYQGFRWTQAAGMVGLGDLPGGSFYSAAWGVNGDGSVIVGESSSTLAPSRDEAFRWTPTDGMVGLGFLPAGTNASTAYAVSADGAIIVGYSRSSNSTSGGAEAYRWTQGTGMLPLGDLSGGPSNSIAYGISADGSTIIGRGTPASSIEEAFRWTAQDSMSALGFLPCDTWSTAKAISADGSVIVGDPFQGSGDCVFIWDTQNGTRSLHEVLVALGVNLTGWQLSEARAISANGNIIVGFGKNPSGQTEAWIANLSPPTLTGQLSGNKILLSWPTNQTGFTLQIATNLVSPVTWVPSVNIPAVVGFEYFVTNNATLPARFYRLSK